MYVHKLKLILFLFPAQLFFTTFWRGIYPAYPPLASVPVHIYIAMALRRGRILCLAVFVPGKVSVLILQEAKWPWTSLDMVKKVSPLQAMKAQGVCGCKGPHIHSHGTDEVGWLVLRSAAFTPGEIPGTHFIGGPQDQSGHEGVKKNLHPSDSRDRTRAVQPVAQRLAA